VVEGNPRGFDCAPQVRGKDRGDVIVGAPRAQFLCLGAAQRGEPPIQPAGRNPALVVLAGGVGFKDKLYAHPSRSSAGSASNSSSSARSVAAQSRSASSSSSGGSSSRAVSPKCCMKCSVTP